MGILPWPVYRYRKNGTGALVKRTMVAVGPFLYDDNHLCRLGMVSFRIR